MTDLARRLVACPRFRWMPGMRTVEVAQPEPGWGLPLWDESIVVAADECGDAVYVCPLTQRIRPLHDGALPDLDDVATLGCLLALVREAWAAPVTGVLVAKNARPWVQPYYLQERDDLKIGWAVFIPQGHRIAFAEDEAEALVGALEAAP